MERFAWGEPTRGLRLGVALEQGVHGPGDPVSLELCLRNNGDHSVKLVESHLLWEYELHVTLEGQGEVAMTEQGRRIVESLEWQTGARRVIEILSGTYYELPWKAPLHEWFEIGRPGRYSALAQRKDWREGDAVLTSGIVRFEVR